jgi:hypothetical protein
MKHRGGDLHIRFRKYEKDTPDNVLYLSNYYQGTNDQNTDHPYFHILHSICKEDLMYHHIH